MKHFVFTCVLVMFFVSPLLAWHTNTHLQMTRDAVSLMPEDMRKAFETNKRFVEAGIKDPDQLIRDWQNHYYLPGEPPEGGVVDRIDKIIKVVQTKLQGSNQLDTGKQLCYLAHYIADIWTPEALIKADLTDNMDFVRNENLVILFEGYLEPITDYRTYLMKRIEWRWRLENSPEVSRILYSEAVNDIARIWLSLWQQSGKTTEPVRPGVVEHAQGALQINYQQLLSDTLYKYDYYDSDSSKSWYDQYQDHQKEVERIKENLDPSSTAVIAKHEMRNTSEWMGKISPEAPFKMLETSVKSVGDQTYFVARLKNKSDLEIPSLAFMYPGMQGPAALVTRVLPGEVVKVEATLPANAKREKIQMIFSSMEGSN